MARLEDKIAEIPNTALRQAIEDEVKALKKNKQFGLVFEPHSPEVVLRPLAHVKRDATVVKKGGNFSETWQVVRVHGDTAELVRAGRNGKPQKETTHIDALTVVHRMAAPIFPALRPIDSVQNGDPATPHHILIEADNYHALQLLTYTYAGKVDCIYIDPPYNTGARDWKYNNDYVDSADQWRHSKWLTFMEKRLQLAKRLLNPQTGVLIVTIDEHEVHHLGCLLGEVFPGSYRQMATIVINQKGVEQGRLARTEEYALFVFMPEAMVSPRRDDLLSPEREGKRFTKPRWERLLRGGNNSRRTDSPRMFYPIFINPETKSIVGIGKPPPIEETPVIPDSDDKSIAWPIKGDGTLGNWQVGTETFSTLVSQGYVKLGGYDDKRKTWTILYLNKRSRERIESKEILITGRNEVSGAVEIEYALNQGSLHAIELAPFSWTEN